LRLRKGDKYRYQPRGWELALLAMPMLACLGLPATWEPRTARPAPGRGCSGGRKGLGIPLVGPAGVSQQAQRPTLRMHQEYADKLLGMSGRAASPCTCTRDPGMDHIAVGHTEDLQLRPGSEHLRGEGN